MSIDLHVALRRFSEVQFQILINHLANNLGEDHEFVQYLITHMVHNAEIDNPNNPYRIHRELLQKESFQVEHHPMPATYLGTEFNINTSWIQTPPKIESVPFTFAKFMELVSSLESKISSDEKALQEF